MPDKYEYTTIVVGGGNAGYTAATTAAQKGSRNVLLIDKCPPAHSGGNSYYTAGAFRTVFAGLEDVLPLVCNVSPELAQKIDMEPYRQEDFYGDLMRVTGGLSHPNMAKALVEESREAVGWLAEQGIQFTLSFNRQAYEVDGRQKFWGGMVLSVKDGGKGLVADHERAAKRAGVTTWYNTAAKSLIVDENNAVIGISVVKDGRPAQIYAAAVVLACGGFEASSEMRAKYLGPGWDLAYVRGTKYNTGDGFQMASAIGAKAVGNWSGCHSTAWDAAAPKDAGDREITNQFTKSGYPLGVMVNAEGKRFVDEGVDFRNFTYAKFGREILRQPGGIAFQVWDDRTVGWLRKEEYADEVTQKIVAQSVEELAEKCTQSGLSAGGKQVFVDTIKEYSEAVGAHRKENPGLTWDPAVKDGLSTQSSTKKLEIAKSNWALPIDRPPFVAVKVSCGITFTFGGLEINPKTAAVMSELTGKPIKNLFCCGEMVGGLFYGNYPGGSGLTAGAVFGRKAGTQAARAAARSDLSRL